MVNRVRAPLSLVATTPPSEVSDTELALGLRSGQAWAVAEVWRRYATMVLKMAERALGSRSDAEDLAQEVFYRVCERARGLRDPSRLRSFVYSIAVRVLKTTLRYRRLRRWLSFERSEMLVDLTHRSLDVESRDLLRRFYALLERLSTRDRLVFQLRRVESMTIDEIATVMNLSESTVKRSLWHASGRLSTWIQADPALAELVVDDFGRQV